MELGWTLLCNECGLEVTYSRPADRSDSFNWHRQYTEPASKEKGAVIRSEPCMKRGVDDVLLLVTYSAYALFYKVVLFVWSIREESWKMEKVLLMCSCRHGYVHADRWRKIWNGMHWESTLMTFKETVVGTAETTVLRRHWRGAGIQSQCSCNASIRTCKDRWLSKISS